MAITTSKLYAVEDAFADKSEPQQSFRNLNSVTLPADYGYFDGEASKYLARFSDFTDEQKRKKFLSLELFLYITNWGIGSEKQFIAERYPDRPLEGITYTNIENTLGKMAGFAHMFPDVLQSGAENSMGEPLSDVSWAEGVVALRSNYINDTVITFHGVAGVNKPYLLLSMEEADLSLNQTPTTGAYLNRHAVAKLIWTLSTSAYGGAAVFTQASATVSWRNGVSGTISTINVSGSEMSCSIPANTVPSTEELQWKVNVSFESGETAESDWATLTTIDSISSCALVSPVSTFIDGSVVNRFTWNHIIATGTAQSKYDLQYSTNDSASWTNIASAVESENQYCDVPADTIPAGTVLWRVRTYNADGAAGTWSDSATIVVQAAPAAPLITSATATPRPEIAWQSSGQQAYQVTAGGYNSGTVFGTAKTHKIPTFLPDGSASIRVRIQNEFGLWSKWATVDVIVANAGSGTVALSAIVDVNTDVRLTWQATGEGIWHYIYRDGALIGRTVETAFTDHLAIGLCSYTVRAVAGDDYILSAPVTVDVACGTAVIADIDTFDWSELPHLRDSEPVVKASATRQVTYQHYSGRRFPLAEIAEYEDETYSFEYSFLDRAEAMAVRELLGKIVAVKTAHDECYVGVLEAMPYSTDWAATDVAFTVRAVDYKDVIEYEI
mgnify:FL=1